MKLRIKGNSIRLRLKQGEVAQLVQGKEVSEEVQFTPMDKFSYSAQPWHLDIIQAKYEKDKLTVYLPEAAVKQWAESDQVSMDYQQENETGGLKILVEKDFVCLTVRPGEDESDSFPNPNTSK